MLVDRMIPRTQQPFVPTFHPSLFGNIRKYQIRYAEFRNPLESYEDRLAHMILGAPEGKRELPLRGFAFLYKGVE